MRALLAEHHVSDEGALADALAREEWLQEWGLVRRMDAETCISCSV